MHGQKYNYLTYNTEFFSLLSSLFLKYTLVIFSSTNGVNDKATPNLSGTANLAAVKKAAESPNIFALSTSTEKSSHCPDSEWYE